MDEGGKIMDENISMDSVYRDYSNMIYKYLLSKTGDEDIAEELTQETFYQAVKSADKFDFSSKVSTWLCAIAKNKLYEYWRKHPKTEELTDNIEEHISLEDQYIADESRLEILKAIHNIPEPAREILYLRLFSNLSFKEIGDILGKTEQWARVTYYRGKLALRKELTENE